MQASASAGNSSAMRGDFGGITIIPTVKTSTRQWITSLECYRNPEGLQRLSRVEINLDGG